VGPSVPPSDQRETEPVKIKSIFANTLLAGAAGLVALLIGEGAVRLVVNPSDYLSVQLFTHEVLGATPSRVSAGGGFDDWGFRNPRVPPSADIVAIGDSHTYGNTATMADSWPYVLGRLRNQQVYNMGLGGYGPNQYAYLLRERALKLRPKTVIVGLYMGDDFENAFLITYGLQHWAGLRELPASEVNFDIWVEPPAPTWHKKVRIWLSRHSVVYQLIVHGPLLGRIQGEAQIRNARQFNGEAVALDIPDKGILEAFLPKGILRRLDQSSSSVREGMRITFKLLAEMNEACRSKHIEFVVAVIPTKETVFADYLERKPELPLSDVLDRLIANERIAREKTFEALRQSQIRYVDTLPALRRSIDQQLYARTAGDMHPGRHGYRVIGEAVAEALR
jgi:hypothetical protein